MDRKLRSSIAMLKKTILTLVVMLVLFTGLGFVKFRQIQAAIAQGAAFQPPPEAVTTILAQRDQWPATISAIGTTAAVRGVTVGADLPGTVERIAFESGTSVHQGDVLVELDTRSERAQLAAAEAQRDLARLNFDRMQGLLKDNVVSKAEYDRAAADERQTEARVGEIRAAIERKTIKAPFGGSLGIRQINLGQYLGDGQAVVSLQALDPIYVNFSVPQQSAGDVRAGREVRITSDDLAGVEFVGRVTAVDAVVDEATRNFQVQATLANPAHRLRPGMFVQAQVVLGSGRPIISLPASSINYAPYGNSVFVVTDLKNPKGQLYRGVKQQFIKLEGARGDQVAVTSGVNAGDEIVTSGVFKLRNGVAVKVNNKVQPSNNPAPKPENS